MRCIIDEIIYQLKCVKNHLDFIKTKYNSVDFDVSVLEACITQLEHINNKPSEDEIIGKLEEANWKPYSDIASRNLLWLDDAIKIVRNG